MRDSRAGAAGDDRRDSVIQVAVSGKAGRFSLDTEFASGHERVVLFGPSGSGKTLTLRSIAGIFRPRRSRIVIHGVTLDDSETGVHLKPEKRNIGYVPQGYALFPHLTVRGNVLYGVSGLGGEEREARLRDVLQTVGLLGFEDARPRNLSGGQQQRVALARALAGKPLVLLLDEPFAAIDTPLRAGLRMEMSAIQSASGTAMVLVTHDLGDAFALGDWIVVLDEGRVLQQGSKDDVYYRPSTRKVAELVGVRNILPGRVTGVSGGLVTFQWRDIRLTAAAQGGAFHAGDTVNACIRSTQLMIRRPEETSFERANVLRGDIAQESIGAETRRLFVRLEGSGEPYDLEVDLPEYVYFRLRLDQGKSIEMSVTPERIHLIGTGAAGKENSERGAGAVRSQ
jgi:molybdate transport system ATP-binding protein